MIYHLTICRQIDVNIFRNDAIMETCAKRAVCGKKFRGKVKYINIFKNGPLKGIFVWEAWFHKTTYQCKGQSLLFSSSSFLFPKH